MTPERVSKSPAQRSIVSAILIFVGQAIPVLAEAHGTEAFWTVLWVQVGAFAAMLGEWFRRQAQDPAVAVRDLPANVLPSSDPASKKAIR